MLRVDLRRVQRFLERAGTLPEFQAFFIVREGSFSIGTLCSGTDMPVVVAQSLASAGSLAFNYVRHRVCSGATVHQQPTLVLLENVLNLGAANTADVASQSNLATCVQKLHEHDIFTTVFHLDPQMFGTPEIRGRLWFVAIPRHVLRRLHVADDVARAFLVSTMQALLGAQLNLVDEFLLDESDSMISNLYDAAVATAATTVERRAAGT